MSGRLLAVRRGHGFERGAPERIDNFARVANMGGDNVQAAQLQLCPRAITFAQRRNHAAQQTIGHRPVTPATNRARAVIENTDGARSRGAIS